MAPKESAFGVYGELPNWVYDIVNAIIKHENEHGPEPESCIGTIRDLIPIEVQDVAEHIKKYCTYSSQIRLNL